MTDVEQCPMRAGVDTANAPMALDRTDGWNYFREQGPVFQDTHGLYCVTDPEAIRYMLRNPKIFSNELAFKDMHSTSFLTIPLAVDPPDHVKYRRVLDPLFSPRQINPMEDELRRQAGALVDEFADKGECDAMADLAKLYPTQVFLTLFGMPLEDRDMCMNWVRTINLYTEFGVEEGGAPEPLQQASREMTAYLKSFIAEKRKKPADDIFSHILSATGDEAWTEEEILGFAFLFTIAGLDTVTATLGFVMHYLATNPDVRRRLVADPELVNPTVEEIIRMEMVSPMVPRVAREDVELCGYEIPAGSFLLMCLGVANRDPEKYPCPNEVDIAQSDIGHFTFGGGIHRCVGSHLARREMRLVVDEFHKRIPEYSVAPGVIPRVPWPSGTTSFESLPLVWDVG